MQQLRRQENDEPLKGAWVVWKREIESWARLGLLVFSAESKIGSECQAPAKHRISPDAIGNTRTVFHWRMQFHFVRAPRIRNPHHAIFDRSRLGVKQKQKWYSQMWDTKMVHVLRLSNLRPETQTFRRGQDTRGQLPRHCTPAFQASAPGFGVHLAHMRVR